MVWGLNYEWVKEAQYRIFTCSAIAHRDSGGLARHHYRSAFLINSAARWVPGLDIASVSGGWRDLTLKGIQYQMPGVTVKAGQFHLSLQLSCLKRSELCVNALTAQDIDVVVDTKALPASEPVAPDTKPLGELSTPYPITLRLLAINHVKVTVDDTAISLDEFRTGAHWQQRALRLMPTNISGLLIALPKTTTVPDTVKPAIEAAITVKKHRKRPLMAKKSQRWSKV